MRSRQCTHRAYTSRAGLTLAEVVVATMLVALILVGALNGVGGAVKMWSAAEQHGEAYGLAQQLLSEIMQQNYEEPDVTPQFGREAGEPPSYRSYDDVDDYVSWSASPPQDKGGWDLPGFDNWTRASQVAWVERDAPNTTSGSETGLKRIIVTVTDPEGVTTELTAWRSASGMLETPPDADVTVQSWIGNELIVGGAGALQNGTVLVNKPE